MRNSISLHRSEQECIARRDFISRLCAASLATLSMSAPKALANSGDLAVQHPVATADACILIWLAGGMAAPDTFDPKRYLPFEKGLKVSEMLSTFPAIDTSVDDIKICEGLQRIGSVLDRGTLIRSHVQPDLGSILHSRHQYHWHTGYVPPQTVAAPHLGAWMAKVLGSQNDVMPAFVNIGQRLEGVGESEELKAFTTSGFFGSQYGPMNLPYPDKAAISVRPPKGMDASRFENRNRLFRKLVDQSPNREFMSDYHHESLMRSLDNAYRLLSSEQRGAFDITQEPKESYEKYNTGRFGQGCLLARRLIEAGTRFAEVTTEYVPFLHFDTHNDGHQTMQRMHAEIDAPIAQLILDLEQRGLLNRTLVVVASEFSRDALIEGVPGSNAADQSRVRVEEVSEMNHYGLHRHFTGGSSVLMFGGGIKKGSLYGSTAAERPLVAIENPVTIEDLHATIMTAMGISPRTGFNIEGRPFYVTKDGKGHAVEDLFA